MSEILGVLAVAIIMLTLGTTAGLIGAAIHDRRRK